MTRERFLLNRGWKEIWVHQSPAWVAPMTLTGKPHVFPLDAAYELEANGEGIESYSASEALAQAARAEDVASMARKEDEQFARTGVHSGISPYY